MLNKKCGHIHDTIVVALFVLDGGCIGDMTNATTFKILHKRYIYPVLLHPMLIRCLQHLNIQHCIPLAAMNLTSNIQNLGELC